MREVRWSSDALDDLDRILEYIARNNQRAALSVVARIERAAETLAELPTGRKGRVARTFEKVVTGLPYIVSYHLDADWVTIVHVIHGARNWPEGGWPEE